MTESTSAGAYFARGVVIVLMVYGHISLIGSTLHAQEVIYEFMHSFRMPVLIMLTGFFFSFHRPGPEVAYRSFRYVVVPYFIFELGYILIHFSANYFGFIKTNTAPIATWAEFFHTIFFAPTGPYWYLYNLGFLQLAVAAAIYVTRGMQGRQFELVALIFIFMLWYLRVLNTDFIVFYLIGVAMRWRGEELTAGILIPLIAFIGFAYLGAGHIDASYTLRVPFVVGTALLLVGIGARFAASTRIVAYLGMNSMSILCWHAYIIACLRPFASLFLSVDPTGISYVLFATVLGTIGSLWLTRLTDRIGLSSLLFGMDKATRDLKRPRPAAPKVAPVAAE
ncbi:acyltransferase family protein [Ancylobacter sp. G4_0304]|uniref:acyltransferase family protein n=1 Tax=Ancylobacter sp. G4_0304 TaxID=3114289 RepID=UPI0039C6B0B0